MMNAFGPSGCRTSFGLGSADAIHTLTGYALFQSMLT